MTYSQYDYFQLASWRGYPYKADYLFASTTGSLSDYINTALFSSTNFGEPYFICHNYITENENVKYLFVYNYDM